ncbi:scaffold protein [Vibrio inusitatus NBRC 102082]|uniref:Scaffold protein n=1 Tax=Vibrio inusitatus NBRC 102082 TaxID=1219070 RepID=A0A4Y3HRX2_9VIBR|nr:MipA/OmpV family protein [Vibrio inusitatus]GEA49767.1 scaffold protein [Vibrio inusitatus NBRC 102082]
MKRIGFSAALLILSSSPAVAGWSLGVGASYSPAVYKDTPSNQVVIPIIGYEGEHLYLRGFTAGYRIWERRSPHNIIFRLAYDPRTLQPSDSDDPIIRQVDKRKSTGLGGVTYQYANRSIGQFQVTFAGDIAGVHDGMYAETVYSVPIRTKKWMLTPSIGYSWNSSKLNNHLYGVSAEEAARISGLDEFTPDGDGQFFLGLRGLYKFTDHILATAGVRYTNLEGDLEDSPLLEKTDSFGVNIGLVYAF